jgi:hypothetical protein
MSTNSQGKVSLAFSVLTNGNKRDASYFLPIGNFAGHLAYEFVNLGLPYKTKHRCYVSIRRDSGYHVYFKDKLPSI